MTPKQRIENLEKKISEGVTSLKEIISEINQIESDVKRASSLFKVKILAWPDQTVYRLNETRLRDNKLVKWDTDLNKNIADLIEETSIESISFKQQYWGDRNKKDVPFDVIYSTGGYYANNNNYKNEDIGIKLFLSKQDLIDVVGLKFEKEKESFRKNIEDEKQRKKEQLQRELENLNK